MIHALIPFRHELFQVPIAERVPEIPTDTNDDHLCLEVSSFEQCWSPCSHGLPSLSVPTNRLCNTSTQGDLIFFGNQYTVDRGVITFSDPARIDPRISISLETTVQSVTVTLGVTGPMNNLKLSYRSDPPLQFEEIVGLLTTGRRPSSDPNIVATEAAPPQQSVAQMGATAVVSQAVVSPLSSRLQRVFGVNQLSIDPTFASGSALPQARLSLQQRVANSVTFTYTQDLSQSNSELIRVEWAVDPRFSVVAT